MSITRCKVTALAKYNSGRYSTCAD